MLRLQIFILKTNKNNVKVSTWDGTRYLSVIPPPQKKTVVALQLVTVVDCCGFSLPAGYFINLWPSAKKQ